jgi:hypothetical protein
MNIVGFIRTKERNGRKWHYLVKSVRVGSRVQQKTIAYLGWYATVDEALSGLVQEAQEARASADSERALAEAARQKVAGYPKNLNILIYTPKGEVPRYCRRGNVRDPARAYWEHFKRAEFYERQARRADAKRVELGN